MMQDSENIVSSSPAPVIGESAGLPEGIVKGVFFRTKEVNQAAFMWLQPGAAILPPTGETNGSSITIYFTVSLPITEEELQLLKMKYTNGQTLVEPLAFTSKQAQLRDLMHGILNKSDHRQGKQPR